MPNILNNEDLIDSYKKALLMNLDENFIALLEEELKRRGIETVDQGESKSK